MDFDNQRIRSGDILDRWETIDMPLSDFIAMLQAEAAKLDAEASEVRFYFDWEYGYYDESDRIECYLYRMETDAEAEERERKEGERRAAYNAELQRRAEANERAVYEALKRKFEG